MVSEDREVYEGTLDMEYGTWGELCPRCNGESERVVWVDEYSDVPDCHFRLLGIHEHLLCKECHRWWLRKNRLIGLWNEKVGNKEE